MHVVKFLTSESVVKFRLGLTSVINHTCVQMFYEQSFGSNKQLILIYSNSRAPGLVWETLSTNFKLNRPKIIYFKPTRFEVIM